MSSERTRDPRGDPSSEPIGTLHVVLLSHLDTQWRWTERDTIERFLAATVDANELLFDRFPFYLLSFEGAYRYRLLAEHDPARFGRVAARVRAGRWHVAGAPLDAFDANLPAPESILRHLLYGSRWLERHLGVVPRELLLPDCFGFPASLPTLAVHAGLHGFSTQKLQKGAEVRVAFGVPFHYGLWIGPDGSTLPSVLDPGEYGKPPARWPGDDPATAAAFESLRAAGRPPRRMAYFGIGDKGGALAPAAVARLDAAAHPTTSVEVAVGRSDAIFEATPPDERDRLPRYRGDLLLRRHGVGCYSAQTAMKRWNRANERLARAAELAASLAARLGRPYPAARLEGAWTRFLVRQMHDDLTGTSIPAAYRLSHGDEALAANDFCEVLLDSLSTVATRLDRSGPGRPVLIFDPYAGRRDGLVEIGVDLGEEERIGSVRDAAGAPLPFQIARRSRGGRGCSSPGGATAPRPRSSTSRRIRSGRRRPSARRSRPTKADSACAPARSGRRSTPPATLSRSSTATASWSPRPSASSSCPTGRAAIRRGRSTGATTRRRRAPVSGRRPSSRSSRRGRCASR